MGTRIDTYSFSKGQVDTSMVNIWLFGLSSCRRELGLVFLYVMSTYFSI